MLPPVAVASHLIGSVEAGDMQEARAQAQRHGCVIRPLAGLKAERSTADHVGDRCKSAASLELHRRADGVTDGQTEKATAIAIRIIHSRDMRLESSPPGALRDDRGPARLASQNDRPLDLRAIDTVLPYGASQGPDNQIVDLAGYAAGSRTATLQDCLLAILARVECHDGGRQTEHGVYCDRAFSKESRVRLVRRYRQWSRWYLVPDLVT